MRTIEGWIYIPNVDISVLLPLPGRTLEEHYLNNLTRLCPKMTE